MASAMKDEESKMDIEQRVEKVDINSIVASKLLNYVRKAELQQILTPMGYANLSTQLQQQLGNDPTLKDIKQFLSTKDDFVGNLRNSAIGQQAFQRYVTAVGRLQGINRAQMLEVRRGMAEPRRRFVGCLAIKIKPDDYRSCLDNYNSKEFENVKLIPSALKQRVFQNTPNDKLKAALAPSINKGRFSDLPSGLRHYISSNPDEFKRY